MGQTWATAAAAYYGIDHVDAFSGGLEVTAFNPRATAALERAAFQLANPGGDNPHVKVTYATNRRPLEAFSKKYGDPFNPKENFAAVMTCSHADAECPLVLGASVRVAIPYEDPKSSDGTSGRDSDLRCALAPNRDRDAVPLLAREARQRPSGQRSLTGTRGAHACVRTPCSS
jgi:arsenate reductase